MIYEMKKIASPIERYNLFILNPYNLVYIIGQSWASKIIIKYCALYFGTEGVFQWSSYGLEIYMFSHGNIIYHYVGIPGGSWVKKKMKERA